MICYNQVNGIFEIGGKTRKIVSYFPLPFFNFRELQLIFWLLIVYRNNEIPSLHAMRIIVRLKTTPLPLFSRYRGVTHFYRNRIVRNRKQRQNEYLGFAQAQIHRFG
jgi:hypothetical protein